MTNEEKTRTFVTLEVGGGAVKIDAVAREAHSVLEKYAIESSFQVKIQDWEM